MHALSALQNLEAGVRSLSGGAAVDLVKVGVLPTVAGGFFPSVALDFAQARPQARTGVITGPNRYLIEMLRRGKIDLMVGRMPSARDMPGLSFEYLYEEPILLVARTGHPALQRPAREALSGFPLILPNPGAIIRETVDRYLAAMGLSDIAPTFETVALPVALLLLERSDMLWFISRGVVDEPVCPTVRRTRRNAAFHLTRHGACADICEPGRGFEEWTHPLRQGERQGFAKRSERRIRWLKARIWYLDVFPGLRPSILVIFAIVLAMEFITDRLRARIQ
ncbi:LysR substrate-binding domain-containing protein [Nitratireductor sp. L15S-10]|uniref:LysR substrate-binding domain-containing protein n=1 Tax=Nitratireductor sp. L15S-10 TaxID=3034028 RepID=UPI0038578181